VNLNSDFKSLIINSFGSKTENKSECFKKNHEFKSNDELALILNVNKKLNNLK
jgi:hypothetical protein